MENNNLESTSVEFQYGKQTVKIETNKIARQATAAVVVTIGDLVVLTTVVAKKEADPAKDFFPLAVCLLYTSPSPRDPWKSRMPSSA